MSDLDNLFTAGQSAGVDTTTTDATATLEPEKPQEEVVPNTEDAGQNITSNSMASEEPAKESTDEEPDYKAMFEAKNTEFESLTKQHRDYQSFHDSKFNDLEKKVNDFQNPPKPEEPPLTEDEINDLYLDNPAKAMQKVMEMQMKSIQPQQQQITPEQMDLQIQEGVQRDQHDDYDNVINNLKSVASYHPEIIEKINASSNKAKTAYELGKNLQNANQPQADPDAFRNQLREEIIKELEEEKNSNRPSLRGVPSSSTNKSSGKSVSTDPFRTLFTAGNKNK